MLIADKIEFQEKLIKDKENHNDKRFLKNVQNNAKFFGHIT